MSKRIRPFLSLPAHEKWVFVQAIGLLPMMALSLRWWGFGRVWGWLKQRPLPAHDPSDNDFKQVQRTAVLVHRAAKNRLFGSNCLKRSLVLYWLLKRQGIDSDLRIGVGRKESVFQAHAWIEYQQRPLHENRNLYDQYKPFDHSLLPQSITWT